MFFTAVAVDAKVYHSQHPEYGEGRVGIKMLDPRRILVHWTIGLIQWVDPKLLRKTAVGEPKQNPLKARIK